MAIEKRTGTDGKVSYRVRIAGMKGGKRTNTTVGTFFSLREARKKEREAMAQRDGGTFVDPSKLTLAEHLATWLDTKRGEVSANVHRDYEIAIRRHIVPSLGRVKLQKLTTAMLQGQVNAWRDADMSAPYIARLCNIITQALDVAVSWNSVPRNVATGIKKPKIERRPATIWTPEQLRRFLAMAREADVNLYPLWQLLASEGMRRGEALGLRWSDLNLARGSVHISQTVVADKSKGGAAQIQPRGKTASAHRQVKLTPQTRAVLDAHRDRQRIIRQKAGDYWQDYDLIVCTSLGTPINPSNVSRSFARLREAAGVPEIRVHDLRHTAASLMLMAGVPVKEVQERVGHANARITLDIYTHLLADSHDLAVDAMSRILEGDAEGMGTA